MPAKLCPHCGYESRSVICDNCGRTVPTVSPTVPGKQHITRTRLWIVVLGAVVVIVGLAFIFFVA